MHHQWFPGFCCDVETKMDLPMCEPDFSVATTTWHGIHSIISCLFIFGWLVEIFASDMFLLVDLIGISILLHKKISSNVGGQCIWEGLDSPEIEFTRTQKIRSAITRFVLGSINLLYLLILIIKLHGLKCITISTHFFPFKHS